jgi:hypothetical protein
MVGPHVSKFFATMRRSLALMNSPRRVGSSMQRSTGSVASRPARSRSLKKLAAPVTVALAPLMTRGPLDWFSVWPQGDYPVQGGPSRWVAACRCPGTNGE